LALKLRTYYATRPADLRHRKAVRKREVCFAPHMRYFSNMGVAGKRKSTDFAF
jgi:hypothetical protein